MCENDLQRFNTLVFTTKQQQQQQRMKKVKKRTS